MTGFALNLSCACVLDLIFGDPQWMPHPVRFLGKMIERGESLFRKLFPSETVSGTALTLGLIGTSFWATYFALRTLAGASRVLSFALEIFLLYSSLSIKDLAVESRLVENALREGDLSLARKKLSWIVGRDTENLSENEILRATVETIAENTVDGILSPMFYAVLGGAPLAIAYKTVNTMDSMIGHKNEKYRRFGKTAAVIDRWVNWIPARISGAVFPLAAKLTGHSFIGSFRGAWNQEVHDNSSIPEGAMAGAIGARLGGDNFYQGVHVRTPLLGEPLRPLTASSIEEAIRVMYAASLLFLVLTWIPVWLRSFASTRITSK